MGYDRGDSFPLDFEPNGNPFGSKSKGKLSPRSYPIQFERKSNTSFLSEDGLNTSRAAFVTQPYYHAKPMTGKNSNKNNIDQTYSELFLTLGVN